MDDAVSFSLARYEAMAGLVSGVPNGVEQRAADDRRQYGAGYLYTDPKDGQFRWCAVHVVRFLVEVCGHSYAEARAGVVRELATFGHEAEPAADPINKARQLYQASRGNIIEAIEANRIEADAHANHPDRSSRARETQFYLETLTFAPAFDGSVDWERVERRG